jgi:hypothetical protein
MAEECSPVASPCKSRGLAWYDWAYSIMLRICQVIAWAAAIYDSVRVAANGKNTLTPVHFGFNAGSARTITVPAGAVAIQAVIDNDYASTYRLSVKQGTGTTYTMPAGCDFSLPVATPIFTATADSKEATRGHGVYPAYTFTWPGGARGFLTAVYPTDTPPAFTGDVS